MTKDRLIKGLTVFEKAMNNQGPDVDMYTALGIAQRSCDELELDKRVWSKVAGLDRSYLTPRERVEVARQWLYDLEVTISESSALAQILPELLGDEARP